MAEIDPTKGTPEKATPEGKEETTPTVQTYNQDQLDKAIHAALTKAGRDAKSLETWKKTLEQEAEGINATKAEVAEWKQSQETALLEAIKKNPDAVDWLQKKKELETERKAHNQEKATLAKEKAEWAETIKATKETQREVLIWKVAQAKGVDPMKLKTLSVKFNIEGEEQLEELAEEITSKVEAPKIKTDSGLTSGSGDKSEEQRLKDRYPTMK